MKKLIVRSASGSYPVHIANGISRSCGALLSKISNSGIQFVTASGTTKLAQQIVGKVAGRKSGRLIVIPDGENSKSLKVADFIWRELHKRGADRSSLLVAIGGGVVGDVAGFAASCYKRGIKLVHIPTSLTAMVDSSIGGKNGINTSYAKNLVGTFYSPELVLVDPQLLETLPIDSLRSGFAEVLKYAVVFSDKLFRKLATVDPRKLSRLSLEIIQECIQHKVRVVGEDEFEGNIRASLNFGHTVGHAIETAANYKNISHGEAVSIGMLLETHFAVERGDCGVDSYFQLKAMIHHFELIRTRRKFNRLKMLKALFADKKRQGEFVFMPILRGVGKFEIKKVSLRELVEFLEQVV